jgi:hypothetical protein
MADPTHGLSLTLSSARLEWDVGPEDDALSIQRFLWLHIARAQHINLYRWGALEETFERPAITIRLLPGSRESDASMRRPLGSSWEEQHQVVLSVYHADRAKTVELGRDVIRLLRDGPVGGRPLSIPIYAQALGAVVARFLRVLRPSIQMGVEDTDDEGKWMVPVNLTVTSPRRRRMVQAPLITRIVSSLNP